MKRTILIFTVDRIPIKGKYVCGGGLRTWGLGEGLKAKGHDVVYSIPKKIVEMNGISGNLEKYAFEPENLRKTIRKVAPDVILFEQWGLATYLENTRIPVVIDLHGSLIIENHFREHGSFHKNVAAKIKALAKADYVVCVGDRQKNYFLPWLLLSGFQINRERIAVIPIGLSPRLPRKKHATEPVFVFGGNLWPWIDPFPALGIVRDEVNRHRKGNLRIFSETPTIEKVLPKDNSFVPTFFDASKLGKSKRVDIRGFIPHDQLIREFSAATVAIDIYQQNRERELAFSTRTIEYLWCGLPVIHADYPETADFIRKYEAGWCIDPNDTTALRNAISEIYSNPNRTKRLARNAQKLVRDHFTWERIIGPLHNFVSEPSSKEKSETFFDLVSLDFDRIEDELGKENERLIKEAKERNDEIASLRHSLHSELKARDGEIWSLNQNLHSANSQLIAEMTRYNTKTEELRKKFEKEIRNAKRTLTEKIAELDHEIHKLNGEAKRTLAENNGLAKKNSELERQLQRLSDEYNSKDRLIHELKERVAELEKTESTIRGLVQETERRLGDLQSAFSHRDKELGRAREDLQTVPLLNEVKERLRSTEASLRNLIQAKDRQIGEYRKTLALMDEEAGLYRDKESALQKVVEERGGHIEKLEKTVSDQDGEIERVKHQQYLASERAEYLQGVLESIQNRLPYKIYKVITYRIKRLFFQKPRLFYLFLLNFFTNVYLSRWCRKNNTRIFPAQN